MAFLNNLHKRFLPHSRWGTVGLAPRREQAGMGWMTAEEQPQPQDGAPSEMATEQATAALRSAKGLSQWNESEDARLTGLTRSLGRRVLGLNVTKAPEPSGIRRPVRASGSLPRVA